MSTDWVEKTLAEFAIPKGISYGIVQPGQHDPEGIPIIRVSDLINGRIDTSSPLCVAPSIEANYARTRLEGGEILISIVGTLGRIAIVPKDLKGWNVARAVGVIKLRDPADAPWLKLCLEKFEMQQEIASKANTTVQHTFNLGDLQGLKIPFPDKNIRTQILDLITPLNDKIDLNRRIDRTLEQIARALFKSWFVDFEPVRDKMRGEHPKGLDAETAALFPDRLVEIEGQKVPEGWRVGRLADTVQFNPGLKVAKQQDATYLDMSSLPTDKISASGWVNRPFGSGSRFQNGDTLLARITPCLENGKAAYVDFLKDGEIGWGSTEYIVMRPTGNTPKILPYLLCRDENFRTFAIGNMNGSSGRQRVSYQSLSEYRMVIPSEDILLKFNDLTYPILCQSQVSRDESAHLSSIRDTLLPQLLSGAIDINKVENSR